MKGTELADHIRDEMAKAGHDYVAMLGELMTEYLRRHPETEIDGKLTLKGAYDALREKARKKAKAGCYAMPPREAFDGMMDYYGLPHSDADFGACMMAIIGQCAKGGASAPTSASEPEVSLRVAATRSGAAAKPIQAANDLADLLDIDALLGV